MSAHARKIEIPGTAVALTDDEWEAQLSKPGLTVIDIYAKWAGPCEPMQNIFKRLKLDYGDQVNFVMAQTDGVDVLEKFRNKSCPTFLFFFNGVLVNLIKGANAPMIEKTIKEQLELQQKGSAHKPLILEDLPSSMLMADIPNVRADIPATVAADDAMSPTSLVSPTVAPSERTLAIIKPEAMTPSTASQIFDIIRRNRFEVIKKKKLWLTSEQVEQLYREHEHASYFQGVLTHMSTAPVLALVLAKDNAVQEWRKVMGPANPTQARNHAASSIRALFGIDNRRNAVYGSESPEAAEKEIELLFGPTSSVLEIPLSERDMSSLPAQSERTLAIIKPDIIDTSKIDAIVERIVCKGYQVVRRETVHLSQEDASELYSHQKEAPYFVDTVAFLSSGPCVALLLKGDDVVHGWREMIGPTDPEVARAHYPMSIRAVFGIDPVRNAVHGSDGPENALREIEQLFPNVLTRSETAMYGTRPSTAAGASRPDMAGNAATRGQNSSRVQSQADLNVMTERTCALIKPDAYAAGKKDAIVNRIRKAGFTVIAEREVEMTREMAAEFYIEHVDRSFYGELVDWMSTLPIYAMVLERDTAITAWRQLAGPTNPDKAKEIAPDSIRALYGSEGMRNAVHGSDSPASAEREIHIIFGDAVSPIPDRPAEVKPTAVPRSATPQHLVPSGPLLERTLALIKPDAYGEGKKDEIVQRIKDEGFTVVMEQEVRWSPDKATEFYHEHEGKGFYDELVAWMSSSPIYAMVLEKDNAIKAWRDLAGPTNTEKARELAPNSIRALYGTDGKKNAVHGSDSPASAAREINVVFGNKVSPFSEKHQTAFPSNAALSKPHARGPERTLALIKPDAYGHREAILRRIRDAGFKVIREQELTLSAEKAGEFYREHASRPFYGELISWMSSASIYAMILEKEDAVTEWRELAGPTDSNKARDVAPHTIRALYGQDQTHNAVHGSDSIASAEREIRMIFPDEITTSGATTITVHHTPAATVSGVPIQRTLALIKPDAYPAHSGDIIRRIKDDGFTIVSEKEVVFAEEVAKEFYAEHVGKNFFDELVRWMCSGSIYAMVLEKEAAISGWRGLAGPTNSQRARDIAPTSIRALYGTDGSHNAVHGSDSPVSAEREIRIVFGDSVSPFPSKQGPKAGAPESQNPPHHAPPNNTEDRALLPAGQLDKDVRHFERTLALIKPDANGLHKSAIISRIQDEGFIIVKESEVKLSPEVTSEFYKEHKGKEFYERLVEWMSSAPIYAMVLEKEDAIRSWRELAGPTNAEKAREVAPNSIRALFGTDGSQNAVHGSDSVASAEREIQLVFGSAIPRSQEAGVHERREDSTPAAAPAPKTGKPSSAVPSRTTSNANLKRSTPALNRGASQKSLASENAPSRAKSTATLAGTTRKSGATPSKPNSRAASMKDLNEKTSRSRSTFGLKSSTLGLNADVNEKTGNQPPPVTSEDEGGEKDAPEAEYEVKGHTEMHKTEGLDKVPLDGDAGPATVDDATNVKLREE